MTAIRKLNPSVLVAACASAAILGTVHGFSVFLEPLENDFGVSRVSASLTYSIALVSLTLSVLLGPRIFARWSGARFIFGVMVLATLGVAVAGLANGFFMVWVGYGLLFGAANGLGYGFSLQIAAQFQPGRESWAMGLVTAAYALGALVSPAMFTVAVSFGGFASAMAMLGLLLLVVGVFAGLLLNRSGARFQEPKDADASARPNPRVSRLWVGYGAGVAAGLMTIGHAAGISRSLDPQAAAWIAPSIMAVFNLLGSLAAGWIGDRISPVRLLILLPLLSGAAALALILGGGPMLYPALGAIGFSYGGIIAACPAAVAHRFGLLSGPRIYGRVFTAWGFAGLAAPLSAAWIFDLTGSYAISLWVIFALALLAALASFVFGREEAPVRS